MIIILGRCVICKIWVANMKVKVTAWSCSKIVSAPYLGFLKFDFKTILQKWSTFKKATCHEQHFSRYAEGQGHTMTLQQNRVRSIALLLKVRFTTISQKWSPYWDDMSRTALGSLPWRSRSQHDLVAKTCLAHNFVIESRILQLFHRNDHHIKMTSRVQHFGRYVEGQGHSMTLH